MKKRLSLIFILLIVSSVLIFTSFAVNNRKNTSAGNKIKTAENEQTEKRTEEAEPQVKTPEEKPKAELKIAEKAETKPVEKPAVAAPKPASPAANIKFINSINNTTIKKPVYINFTGKTAYDATLEALHLLGQDPRPTEIDRVNGYFKGMLGYIEKRSGGPNSGWLFYVNGVKATVGSKAYNLKNGDKLVWKFVEDYTKC